MCCRICKIIADRFKKSGENLVAKYRLTCTVFQTQNISQQWARSDEHKKANSAVNRFLKSEETIYMLAPILTLSQFWQWDFFCTVPALGEFVPVLGLCWNGDPVLALGALFENWVLNHNTILNTKNDHPMVVPQHARIRIVPALDKKSPSAWTVTGQGWGPTYTC